MKVAWITLLLIFCGDLGFAAEPSRRMIALTIDDAPRPDTVYLTGMDRATKLIAAL